MKNWKRQLVFGKMYNVQKLSTVFISSTIAQTHVSFHTRGLPENKNVFVNVTLRGKITLYTHPTHALLVPNMDIRSGTRFVEG